MKKITHCKTCNSTNIKEVAKNVYSFGFKFDIVECLDCKLRFRNIELGKNETEDLYSSKYFLKEQRDYFFNNVDYKKRIFTNRIKLIDQYCTNKGKVLDIGSAVGLFIEVAKNDGWEETGIEISSFASNYAKEKGLKSLNRGFENLEQLNQTFDVITIWDVVDHAERPLELLKEAHKVVKNGGYIFVETTIIDSAIYRLAEIIYDLSFRLIKAPFLKGYPVHHSNYYSEETMKKDIEKAGFKSITSIRETLGETIFSGGILTKWLFKIIEKVSIVFHKEIVCIIVARAIK